MGLRQTFKFLSRFGIVPGEFLGSTDPVRLGTEEMLVPDSALGISGSLFPQIHGFFSVVADNSRLILRWIERGHFDRLYRLRTAGSGE